MLKSYELLANISELEKELSEQIKKDFPIGTKVMVKRGKGKFTFEILKHDITEKRNSTKVYGKSETGAFYWVDIKYIKWVIE